jgi:hypothetical protein
MYDVRLRERRRRDARLAAGQRPPLKVALELRLSGDRARLPSTVIVLLSYRYCDMPGQRAEPHANFRNPRSPREYPSRGAVPGVPGWSHGHTKGIVEVHTDEGIVGFGEVATLDDADYLARTWPSSSSGSTRSISTAASRRPFPSTAPSRIFWTTRRSGCLAVSSSPCGTSAATVGRPPPCASRRAGADGGQLLRILLLPARP